MMPRAATRRIAHSLRTAVAPASSSFLPGEIFTGPGVNALEMLRFQLGPDGLDSVFDFPLMWSLHEVIARGQGDFRFIEALLFQQCMTKNTQVLSATGTDCKPFTTNALGIQRAVFPHGVDCCGDAFGHFI